MGKAVGTPQQVKGARISTVSSRNQVTIPADVRVAAGIGPGTGLVFTPLPDGRIVVRQKSGTLADLRGAALRKQVPAKKSVKSTAALGKTAKR